MNLQELDFNKLDFNEIGCWPLQMRIVALVLIGIMTIAATYFLFISQQITDLYEQHKRQISMRNEFRDKYHKAANLEAYKQQMEESKKTLTDLLQQLPSEGKVPSLMEDISLQATDAGLEFNLIKPGNEVVKEFYTELPIKMLIAGSYHGFGRFISGLAKLPRIVTLHNFTIKSSVNTAVGKQSERHLVLEIEAKTYWCANRENL